MKSRCYNPNDDNFPGYGGRGIIVCPRWLESFNNFFEDMGERPLRLTLGRMNNDGNYEPGNCRWETDDEQRMNKTTTRKVVYEGCEIKLRDLCVQLGKNLNLVGGRLAQGWSLDAALNTPVKHYKPKTLKE